MILWDEYPYLSFYRQNSESLSYKPKTTQQERVEQGLNPGRKNLEIVILLLN